MKHFKQKAALFASTAMASAASFAAAADPFTDAVAATSLKVGVYGAALVTVAALGVGASVGIKYVKKISRAA